LPDVGEGIAEAELVEWHVKVGDIVREDDLLAAVMTDKATVEIPRPIDGECCGSAPRSATRSRSARDRALKIAGEGNAADELENLLPRQRGACRKAKHRRQGASAPRPSRLRRVEPAVRKAPACRRLAPCPADARAEKAPTPKLMLQRRRPCAASGRRKADRLAQRCASRRAKPASICASSGLRPRRPHHAMRTSTPSCCAVPKPDTRRGWPRRHRHRHQGRRPRRKIAEKMALSKSRIPHITIVEEVNVTPLEDLRATLNKKPTPERPKLTLLPFLMRAMVKAISEQPQPERSL
jgi:2-oxoisovalerate dehydrogenase E2 component (dihydrolipoyl transacylase)